MDILMSLVGVVTILAIGYALSNNRKAINVRTVGGALAIQAFFAGFVLYVPVGKDILQGMSDAVSSVISYAQSGINFVFGDLAQFKVGFIFAVNVLPVIVFFSSLIAVLYYLGIMQWIIRLIGGGLQKALGTSRTESMSATANIFVGQTEAPLVVRPFIATMTNSELFAIMVGGLASIAGSVLAGYAQMGVPIEYLVAASFMAAPGGLMMAKLMHPETEEAKNDMSDLPEDPDKPANVLDAAAGGASSGMHLALNVGAMLIAFVGLIAMVNGIIGGVTGWFGLEGITLELILGYIFMPLAFLIGVPWNEALVAGSFIGQKIVVNEFVAYLNFAPYLLDASAEGFKVVAETGMMMSDRTKAIISFALCGFANLSSIAILLGGLGSMAPSRRHDLAKLGIRAVIAGSLANLMSATLAGLFLAI
ncbi:MULTISPECIES: NupC/NupG family nucleoside CNT transporter [unclassified Shewanella]|uniref:NupC/NupG family nucleoside CNT transporter n=1 Tax=unclassified Shewanella TaxID=196818 RepID=UPI000C83C2C7|nr:MULTISPECIES: NupC/NupG family nucleoside CNT transporter [unclassified Shewanella]MDO6619013.1 NupC/NupG family nucleoside CNT transporter [Shewanella sp. 6_MG-2023]MDO6640064.1 NupC/NupG family nucleoside CNT transporter [Shewanella sp. 5_MG-2023]MDO6677809.1 NupC/NupG family nucleoside CNT transporter [Shewanella sp. 4_MG-2023]MDO6775000.1 NupC/NupG family nucleoside CNT transporter [Shewanella sp. 3_MG-2023]PMG26960.1 nucleoside transporter NupC [Shewanella sp. 10N.286.52.C2]